MALVQHGTNSSREKTEIPNREPRRTSRSRIIIVPYGAHLQVCGRSGAAGTYHDVIPQLDVLPIICVWYGMMRVVCAYREDGYGCEGDVQRRNIEPRVVEGGGAATHNEEEDARDGVDGNQEPRREVDGEDVVVLAQYELERMYVDGIGIATCGHNLPVMMLVHVRVHRAVMERAVEGRVEEIVHDEKEGSATQVLAKEISSNHCTFGLVAMNQIVNVMTTINCQVMNGDQCRERV